MYSPKEIEVDMSDGEGDAVADDIAKAVTEGTGMLWLTDRRGRRVGVPTDKLSWVEIGADSEERRVGFSAP